MSYLTMSRLNSEDFSKFFLCLDISLVSTHLEVNIHDFFDFFEVFHTKIPHGTVHVTSLRDVEGKSYHVFYGFFGG